MKRTAYHWLADINKIINLYSETLNVHEPCILWFSSGNQKTISASILCWQ